MPRTYFCSFCGMELTHLRRSLKNKGVIRDLIKPHDCDEEFIDNIVDADKPTKNAIRSAEPTEVTQEEKQNLNGSSSPFDLGGGDKRDKKHLRESSGESPISAPSGVKQMIKDESRTSGPEGNLEEP